MKYRAIFVVRHYTCSDFEPSCYNLQEKNFQVITVGKSDAHNNLAIFY